MVRGKVKVAAVQSAPESYNLEDTLEYAQGLAGEAKDAGARLVVFPEAFICGYPRHTGFNIGSRSDEDRKWYSLYVESSVKIPPDAFDEDWFGRNADVKDCGEYEAFRQLCSIAKTKEIYLSMGVVERSLVGHTLWCTNLLFSPKGVLLSRHRKLQPTAAERVVWGQGEAVNPGGDDNMPVVNTEFGRTGGLICWENFMPLSRYILYKKGVEIYIAPTADARPTWLPSMQHIAQEGRCFVISANQYQTATDFPADYPHRVKRAKLDPEGERKEVWSRGGSCIIGPLGEVLAGPLWDEAGIIYAELDLDQLIGARLDFDPVGHYAREELLLGLINKA